jgi:hypothetical protein
MHHLQYRSMTLSSASEASVNIPGRVLCVYIFGQCKFWM